MSLPVTIVNGEGGQKRSALVDNNFALRTAAAVPEVLPSGTPNRARYFNDFLYNGLNPEMAVDGSVTPVEYAIAASEEYDLYITKLIILIASGQIQNNKFGDLPALTNGWSLYVVEQGLTTFILDAVTTTGELTIESGGVATSLANWNPANDNARSIVVDLANAFPFETQRGLRIGRGSRDKFAALVQDDLSGLSEFTVRAIGARHYPE
jgi:hypothetical protein